MALDQKIQIAPSILSADFGKLNEEIASIEAFSDLIHVDVMDGHFVPNITIGPTVISFLKTKLPLDVHLMIENPSKYVPDFIKAIKDARQKSGVIASPEAAKDAITVHIEATKELPAFIKNVHAEGLRAGISVKPQTAISEIFPYLSDLDLVLIMTVEPGFGGQQFMSEMLPKITMLREKAPEIDIAVDGGINDQTANLAINAGANILVAGNYIFSAKNRQEAASKLSM